MPTRESRAEKAKYYAGVIEKWLDADNGATDNELSRGILTLSTSWLEEFRNFFIVISAEPSEAKREGA